MTPLTSSPVSQCGAPARAVSARRAKTPRAHSSFRWAGKPTLYVRKKTRPSIPRSTGTPIMGCVSRWSMRSVISTCPLRNCETEMRVTASIQSYLPPTTARRASSCSMSSPCTSLHLSSGSSRWTSVDTSGSPSISFVATHRSVYGSGTWPLRMSTSRM